MHISNQYKCVLACTIIINYMATIIYGSVFQPGVCDKKWVMAEKTALLISI